MKKFIIFIVCLVVFLIPQSISAQSAPTGDCTNPIIFNDYSICLSNPASKKDTIDTGVHWVTMNIYNVTPDSEGKFPYYCLKSNPKNCDDEDLKPIPSVSADGTLVLNQLCGDGASKLKLKSNCSNTGSDYFHEGKTYRVTLFDKKKSKAGNVVFDGAFYVTHYYPKVVLPAKGKQPDWNTNTWVKEGKIPIKLEGRNQKDTGSDSDKYNDYWIQVEGQDNTYKSLATCINIPPGDGIISMKNPDIFGNPIMAGNYMIKIKDAKGNCEENDFVYYYIPFKIAEGSAAGYMGDYELSWDPFQKEVGLKKYSPPVEVCAKADKDGNGYCTAIPTALGIKIHTRPELFVRDVFTIVLSVGGVLAIAFFIRAGYILMTSAGNKEKVGAAREQITSAIMGLVFIILSITILEFIGIDILQIPGFTR